MINTICASINKLIDNTYPSKHEGWCKLRLRKRLACILIPLTLNYQT